MESREKNKEKRKKLKEKKIKQREEDKKERERVMKELADKRNKELMDKQKVGFGFR